MYVSKVAEHANTPVKYKYLKIVNVDECSQSSGSWSV